MNRSKLWFCEQRDLADHLHKVSYQTQVDIISKAKEEMKNDKERNIPPAISYAIQGGTATVYLHGVMENRQNFYTRFFGIATYEEVRLLLDKFAYSHNEITNIVFDIDSGGGEASGAVELADYIRNYPKYITSVVNGHCCSSAYFLASATKKISASEGSVIGCIGAISFIPKYNEDMVYVFRSSGSEHKNNAEGSGAKQYQDIVDGFLEMFTDRLSNWRGSAENYKGEIFLCRKALDKGLIDAIIDYKGVQSMNNGITITGKEEPVNEEKLELENTKVLLSSKESEIANLINLEKEEKERVMKILEISDVSSDVVQAIVNKVSAGDFAVSRLNKMKEEIISKEKESISKEEEKQKATESLKSSIVLDAKDVNDVSAGVSDIGETMQTQYKEDDYLKRGRLNGV